MCLSEREREFVCVCVSVCARGMTVAVAFGLLPTSARLKASSKEAASCK